MCAPQNEINENSFIVEDISFVGHFPLVLHSQKIHRIDLHVCCHAYNENKIHTRHARRHKLVHIFHLLIVKHLNVRSDLKQDTVRVRTKRRSIVKKRKKKLSKYKKNQSIIETETPE